MQITYWNKVCWIFVITGFIWSLYVCSYMFFLDTSKKKDKNLTTRKPLQETFYFILFFLRDFIFKKNETIVHTFYIVHTFFHSQHFFKL